MATLSKISLGLCLYILMASAAYTQPIKIVVNVMPPITNDLTAFIENPNKILIQVINTSGQEQSIKFHARMTGDNGVFVNTKEFYNPKQPYKMLPFESKILDINDIIDYGSESDFDYGGINITQVIRTRKLPEGNYSFCLEAYDFNSAGITMPLSSGFPSGCAYNLQLVTLDPPQIISVGMGDCGETLLPSTPQLVNIMWLPPAGLIKMIKYNVQMVEVIPTNRDINDAMTSNTGNLFLDEWVSSTVFTINSTHQQLNVGSKYAFRVRAVDPDNSMSFRNDGYSQVCSFTWGIEENFMNTNFSQQPIFPQSIDTLPFINIAVVAPWAPFDNNLSRLTSQITLIDNAVTVGNRMNSFSFSPNIISYASNKCNGQTVPNEEIQQFLTPSAPSYFTGANLTKGKNYDLELINTFEIRNNPIEQTIVNTTGYHYGMPVPKSVSPQNNAIVEPGDQSFTIRTGRSGISPFLNGRLSRLANATQIYDYNTPIKVDEGLVFELSGSSNFNTIVNRQIIRLEYERNLGEISALYDSVFKTVRFNVSELTAGVYYWRVKYLEQPTNTNENAPAYRIGGTRKLTVGSTSGNTEEPCLTSNCNAAPVPQDRRVPVATMNIGSWLKMGDFDLLVSSITQSQGSRFSGEGLVLINPFPTGSGSSGFYPVKVAFENLRFNSSNQVFEGTATTISMAQNPWNRVSGSALPQGNDIATLKQLCESAPSANAAPASADASYYTQNTLNTPFVIPVMKNGLINYDFSILGIQFTPTSSNLNCALTVMGTEENQSYTFMAANLCLKPSGWASEMIEMNLLQDINFDFLGSNMKVEGFKKNQAHSMAVWDCSGFRHLRLIGNVQFSRELIRPVSNYNGPTNRVTGFFDMEAISLDDAIYSVAIQEPYHFSIAGKTLSINSPVVFVDRSESRNPIGLTAPAGYNGTINNSWNGVFFPQMEVKIDLFGNQTIQATNFFYDGQITGRVSGTNIFDINQQVIGNMNISLDTVDINLIQNNFRRYHFAGKINPRLNETFTLNYLMDCDLPDANGQSNLHGRVIMSEGLNVPLDFIYSTFVISPTSTLIFDKTAGDTFRPVLTLNGRMTLQGDFDKIGEVNLPQMEVNNMKLRSNPSAGEKYFETGTISFSSPQKYVGGFPITITDVEDIFSSTTPGEFGMNFIYQLGLGTTQENFSVTGNLGIKAKAQISDHKITYAFKSTSFDSLSVQGNISVADFGGKLYFFKNDPTYGNGLKGNVHANFEPGISLLANAYFGKKRTGQNTHNYWGVFGGVRFSEAVPVIGLIECKGFAGGVFYNMTRAPEITASPRRVQEPNSSNIAVNLVPEDGTVGFSAKVWLQSTGGGDAFKSMSTLNATFNSNSWAIRSLNLLGNMWIMPVNNSNVPVWADMNVDLNFLTKTLSGTLNAYIQHSSLEGTGTGSALYRAGNLDLLIAPHKWHLYVGQPHDRVGVQIPALGAALNAYLCVGSEVPGVPELPQRIRDVLSGTTIGNFRDANVATGKGFAFGAFFDFNPPPATFLIFRGDLDLMLGFDLSLTKYTGDVSCDGINTLPNFGLNKWYAQGQMYAYVYASLGIHVDVWFAEGNFNIFRGEAGVALAAGMPNPTWATGALAGNYRILGGAIKGKFTYEFSLGSVCRPTQTLENPVANLKVIEDVSVGNNARNISPFATFSASLNFKPNQVFSIEITDDAGNELTRTFRAKVSPKLKKGVTNIAISNVTIDEGAGDDVFYRMDIQSVAALSGNNTYQLSIDAHFEERKNSQWAVAVNKRGEEVRQNITRNFTTGALPDRIPASIVAKSTPTAFENYFKVIGKQSSTGPTAYKVFRMEFQQNIRDSYFYDSANHVLPNVNGGTFVGRVAVQYKLRITDLNNNSKQDYNLSIATQSIHYSGRLTNLLLPNTKYKIEVIRKKILPLGFIEDRLNYAKNLNVTYSNIMNNNDFNLQKRNLTFEANGAELIDHIDDEEFKLFEYYFKTSKFNSIYDKIQQLTLLSNHRESAYKAQYFIFNSQERFSQYEIENEVKLVDVYNTEKQYFDKSGLQYYMYNILKQKAVGTPFATFASPEPFVIETYEYSPGSKSPYALLLSHVDFNDKERFLNQISEPSSNEVHFSSSFEFLVSFDRPNIQNYFTNYLSALSMINSNYPFYNQVNLSRGQKEVVREIIATSWPRRVQPDPDEYRLMFRMLKPDGASGGIRNYFYHINE